MLNNIIYILATSSLLTGSILTFNKDNIPDYFYLWNFIIFYKIKYLFNSKSKKIKKIKIFMILFNFLIFLLFYIFF